MKSLKSFDLQVQDLGRLRIITNHSQSSLSQLLSELAYFESMLLQLLLGQLILLSRQNFMFLDELVWQEYWLPLDHSQSLIVLASPPLNDLVPLDPMLLDLVAGYLRDRYNSAPGKWQCLSASFATFYFFLAAVVRVFIFAFSKNLC